jgi:hypothetical protein
VTFSTGTRPFHFFSDAFQIERPKLIGLHRLADAARLVAVAEFGHLVSQVDVFVKLHATQETLFAG